jgi:hypothetical protein
LCEINNLKMFKILSTGDSSKGGLWDWLRTFFACWVKKYL